MQTYSLKLKFKRIHHKKKFKITFLLFLKQNENAEESKSLSLLKNNNFIRNLSKFMIFSKPPVSEFIYMVGKLKPKKKVRPFRFVWNIFDFGGKTHP